MVMPKNFIIGMLIFCVFIVGGIFLIGDFGANNSDTNQFNNTFYLVDNITGDIEDIRGSTENAETDFGAFGVLNSLINSAWTGLKILFRTGDLTTALAADISLMFGLPSYILYLISLMVVVVIAFAIWGAIFQRDL